MPRNYGIPARMLLPAAEPRGPLANLGALRFALSIRCGYAVERLLKSALDRVRKADGASRQQVPALVKTIIQHGSTPFLAVEPYETSQADRGQYGGQK